MCVAEYTYSGVPKFSVKAPIDILSQYRTAAPSSWRYWNGRCGIFKVDGFRELVHFNGQDRFVVEGCARAAVRIDGIEDGLHHFFRLQSATTLYNFLHALRAELFTGGVERVQNAVAH